jgi:prepilin-type N-terminal cleavage/methylation domain-containing protein
MYFSQAIKQSKKRGFTMIELMVSISIMVVIAAIVLTKYTVFDSTVLLKSVAYDIALMLREAQVKSVSATRGTNSIFDYPFGVTFAPASKTYTAFRFNATGTYPWYDEVTANRVTNLQSITIDRSMRVQDVCIFVGGTKDCNIARLDVSFRRPEYAALFYAKPDSGPDLSTTITSAEIVVDSTRNSANTFKVRISGLGQMTVCKTGASQC